jgi:anti-sigma factor RsiW
MRCHRARRLLSPYLDGEVDPRRRASLVAHLSGCEACSAELRRLRDQQDALVVGDQVPPLPPDLWGSVLSALDDAERLPWHRRHRARLVQAACVAACVVLGFGAGAALSWRAESVSERVSMGERAMIAEAFDVTAFNDCEVLRCGPR